MQVFHYLLPVLAMAFGGKALPEDVAARAKQELVECEKIQFELSTPLGQMRNARAAPGTAARALEIFARLPMDEAYREVDSALAGMSGREVYRVLREEIAPCGIIAPLDLANAAFDHGKQHFSAAEKARAARLIAARIDTYLAFKDPLYMQTLVNTYVAKSLVEAGALASGRSIEDWKKLTEEAELSRKELPTGRWWSNISWLYDYEKERALARKFQQKLKEFWGETRIR